MNWLMPNTADDTILHLQKKNKKNPTDGPKRVHESDFRT